MAFICTLLPTWPGQTPPVHPVPVTLRVVTVGVAGAGGVGAVGAGVLVLPQATRQIRSAMSANRFIIFLSLKKSELFEATFATNTQR